MSATKHKRGEHLTVKIDRLSVGGRGVARHEKLVIFVPDTAPDEEVEVELTLVKKNYAEARLLRIIRPSLFRIVPPCPVAGICGGCNWQHISYEEQLRQKRQLVRESIAKFSGYDVSATDAVLPVIASPKEFRYRNRIQVHSDGAKFGFNQRGSRSIVDINDCLIAESAIASELPKIKRELQNQSDTRTEVFVSEAGHVHTRCATTTFNSHTDNDRSDRRNTDQEMDRDDSLAFSQVNTAQNKQMISLVLDLMLKRLAPDMSSTIYDLYSGNGNFTFPIARAFPNAFIASSELNLSNVEHAKQKAKTEFPGRKFHLEAEDVALFLSQSRLSSETTVLLDPPRTGCEAPVIEAIAKGRPRHIIYISCHPVTLARDLRALRDAGYELTVVQPLDMFPQTDHVETVVALDLRPS